MNKCRHDVEASTCEVCRKAATNEAHLVQVEQGNRQARDEIEKHQGGGDSSS